MSANGKNLWGAMLAAQQECPDLTPDATNPHFRSRFVSLDNLLHHVLPVLNKHDLVLTQLPTIIEGQPALRTTITHASSGESVTEVMPLLLAKNDPQGQGAAITYARRYALTAALGIAEEDDDANSASRGPRRQQAPRSQPGSGSRSPTVEPTSQPGANEGGGADTAALTNRLYAATEKLGARLQAEFKVQDSLASRDPAAHLTWLRGQVTRAENEVEKRAKEAA